ncbi:outer membrane protein assembly factor BamD [Lutibaculum baratangense]|nr:outer membrane protein assembly factor BamD [Lutibaculum baratangense]
MSTPKSTSRARAFPIQSLRALMLASVALTAAGCSGFGGKSEFANIQEDPADQLYNEGLALISSGSYNEAVKKFEEVDRIHPYSEWARRSLLMATYANYEGGNYTDAIASGRRYVTLYPGSEDAAYAQYLVAESYYQELSDVGRDQQRAERASAAYREILEKYPNSEYAVQAREKLDVARDQLAGKEMEVGRYYLGKRQYLAAINRFRTVVTDYQTTRHVEEALLRLTESYYALGIVQEAQTAAAVLGYNYPDSQWYRDAHTLLQKGGYEPEENKKSWISRAFSSSGSLL